MLKKKCMSFFLSMLFVLTLLIVPAGTASAVEEGAMTVSAKDGYVAVRTSFNETQDYVQQIANLYTMNDPARTTNRPVDFGKSYLIEKSGDIWTAETSLQTLSAADEATPLMLNSSYMGANHGQDTGMTATVTGHGLTYADIGSRWTATGTNPVNADETNITWNLLRIVDENTLLFLSDNLGSNSSNTYNFGKGLKGTMTLEGGSKTLTVEGTASATQIQPSIRHNKKEIYAVKSGMMQPVAEGGSYEDCDRVIIEESYEIINPTTIAGALRENAPAGGYTENPDLAAGGESMLTYHVTYTVMPDGTILTEVDHEVLTELRVNSYGLLQYPVKQDYAGGGIYRYLPNTKAFTVRGKNQASGETQEFDFSTPYQIVGDNADYPHNTVLTRADGCVDTSYPTERFVDYFRNTSGENASAYVSGYLPFGLAAQDKWSGAPANIYYFYGSSQKHYPRFYEAYRAAAGTAIEGVGYKKLAPVDAATDMSTYTIPYNGTLYTYTDFFATGKSVTLPDGYTVVNQSANVAISDGVATVTFAEGDTHGYIAVSSPDTGAAELTKAEVLSSITAEKISTEPLSFVTKNLSLPVSAPDAAVQLSWASSDESVIAADGTVTRHPVNEKTVTLTATVTDADGSETVTHTVTVQPLRINSYKQETFYYPSAKTDPLYSTTGNSSVSGWWTTSTTGFTALNTDSGGSYYATIDYTSVGGTLSSSLYTSAVKPSVVYLYMLVQSDGTVTNGVHLRPTIRQASNNGAVSGLSTTVGKIHGNAVYAGRVFSASAGSLTTGSFVPVIFKLDLPNNQISAKVGDGSWSTPGEMYSDYTYVEGHFVGEISFVRGGSTTAEPKLLIAEAAAYTEESLADYIAGLTDTEEKLSLIADMITLESITTEPTHALTQNLDLDGGYDDLDLSACGVSVTWASSAASAVSAEGVVTQSGQSQPVTLTATVASLTDPALAKTVSFGVTVAPAESTVISNTAYGYNEFENSGNLPTVKTGGAALPAAEVYLQDEDEGHGTALTVTNESLTSAKYFTSDSIYNLSFDKRYYISCDVKYERGNAAEEPGAYGGIEILGNEGASAVLVYLQFENRKIQLTTSAPYLSDTTVKNTHKTYTFDMPESVSEGEWMHLMVDYNVLSRSYQLYVNGELINELPLLKANIDRMTATHPVRGFQLSLSKAGTLAVDNLSIRQSASTDSTIANAGLNAALISYAQESTHHALPATAAFAAEGPASYGTKDTATSKYILNTEDTANNPGLYTFSGGAALSYQIDGEEATSITPAKPDVAAFTVTSAYNGVTETKTVTRKIAPTSVDAITMTGNVVTGITLAGDLTGKAVLAAYNNGTLVDVATYNAAAELTTNMDVTSATDVKVFVFDSMTGLVPRAHARIQ